MHILSLTDFLGNVGGAELSAHTITTGFVDHPDVSKVTAIGVDLPDVDQLDFSGVTVDPVSLPGFVADLPDYFVDHLIERAIARRARSHLEDVDLVHAHHRRSMLALARVDTDRPTVGTVRDYWPICPISVYTVSGEQCGGCDTQLDDCVEYQGWNGLKSPIIKKYLLTKRRHQRSAFGEIDRAIFISDHLRQRVSDAIDTPPSEIIYNPVDVDQSPHLAPPENPVFVTASSLTKEKGVDLAVKAMHQVTQSFPHARLVILGDGPERKNIERLARELPETAIELRGRVSPAEVYETISEATATIFPSRWDEPFGRITVESMQLGTPVVGAAVGGIAEIIESGETGLLFERDDQQTLAEVLCGLVHDEPRWLSLARAGLKVAEEFTPEKVIDSHVSYYKSII
jgi:glycosyltransferase involved in cell wall biosynthesis